jgi:hemolysin III
MSIEESHYRPFEEASHSISHGIGALLSVIGTGLIWQKAYAIADWQQFAAALLFGFSLILLYTCSACYHGSIVAKTKARWRKLDHAAIYVLIAGTYTPFTMISMRDSWGFYLVLVIWAIAIAGVVMEFVAHLKFKKLSLVLYLVMGWLVMVAIGPLTTHVPSGGLWWLLAGGLCYSGGVIFYVNRKIPYHHLILHLFVLAGSICHFIAVYAFVLPQ